MSDITKILIDTDIGGDIDDALTLAMALNSPEVDIRGITSVYIAGEWRVGVIRCMLETYGRTDIEVAIGAEKPLCGWWDDKRQLSSHLNVEGTVNMPACDYIIKKVNEEKDLTLLAIGPLTNIALAISKDPDLPRKTRLVLMGGQVTRAHPEWNIACDPEAARIVFESGIPIRMIGLDVTNRCKFDHGHIGRIKAAGNKRTDLLSEMLDKFLKDFNFMPTLHDPLALASIIWPELLTFEEKTILIETRGEFTRGVTVDCDWKHEPNAQVAVDVRKDEFIERVLARLVL